MPILLFFHLTTILHRSHNSIHHIVNSDNVRITDIHQFGDMFIVYYSNLFSSSRPSFPYDLQGLILPSIDDQLNASLTVSPLAPEIYKTVLMMQGNKSPGPDGMTPLFYKSFWRTIDKDLVYAVQKFFEDGKLSRAINHTFLALIPKQLATAKVEQFRPIALCNIAYKVVTKLLASRLHNALFRIIHPSQVAFIPSRSIIDNCIINHVIMHYLKRKKGKNGLMAIKIDMAKAYDMVE